MPGHSLTVTTFQRPTYCDECGGLLWGWKKQGLQCADCDYVSHHGCANKTRDCVSSRPSPPPSRSAALQSPISSAQIETAVVSAAILSMDSHLPVSHYLATLPPLHPQTTTRNFTRFVSRCGPVFGFRDKVILLLNWDKPIDTFVALVAYCFICFYPKLLLFVPQLVILTILMAGYFKRAHPRSDPMKPPATTEPTFPDDVAMAGNKRTYLGGLASSLFPVFDETSPEYGRNLQNMQNMMGESSDMYDIVQAHAYLWDWSDEDLCGQLIVGVLLSMVLVSAAVYFVSFRTICLVGGVSMFLGNTRFAKHLISELAPLLLPLTKQRLLQLSTRQHTIKLHVQQQLALHEVSLYENQRWSDEKKAFTAHLLPSERGPWSDYTGLQKLPSNKQVSNPPAHSSWLEKTWQLDTLGAWKNALGIEQKATVDKDGWAYYTDAWLIRTDGYQPGISTRRRRRWVRHCEQQASQTS
ncbi:hypothetical protein DM01DRAFT_1379710 [Hesseltinella vesiculosa]|uniref:Phorbol-ester/DAG-type domain-containing protein n=1 Tax=Hesseltinella vesiculosa TaxID=101127 RepID=A0A1X2GYM7_9FUNG|nr:hypothetical protein DM01DRAFT_1379710 [Hesseltinella vesiculosa]